MTTRYITLTLESTSTEGIADFVPALEKVIDDIKGGYEENKTIMGVTSINWKITPHD